MFTFTFTSLPTRFYNLLRALAGAKSDDAEPSPIVDEGSITSVTSPDPASLEVTYYADDEFEESASSPPTSEGLQRLHRRSRSPKPLDPTTRKQAKAVTSSPSKRTPRELKSLFPATNADVSSPIPSDRRREKRARRDASDAPGSDAEWAQPYPAPANGVYGAPSFIHSNIAEHPYPTVPSHPTSSLIHPTVVSDVSARTWTPPTPPTDNGVGITGDHVRGQRKKRKRCPGKKSTSVSLASTSKTSTPHAGDAISSSASTRHNTTSNLEVAYRSASNLDPYTSPVLPPSPAPTSPTPRTDDQASSSGQSSPTPANDTDDSATFVENAIRVFSGMRYSMTSTPHDEEWVELSNEDEVVHTRFRSDSPTANLIAHLINRFGLQMKRAEAPKASEDEDSPDVSYLASTPAVSPKELEPIEGPSTVVSGVSYVPPAVSEDLVNVRLPIAELHVDTEDRGPLGADTTADALGQRQFPGNLTSDVDSIAVPVSTSSGTFDGPVVEQAAGPVTVAVVDEAQEANGQGIAHSNLTQASESAPSVSNDQLHPVQHIVYSQYHMLGSKPTSLNAWYKHDVSFVAARIQLHLSTFEGGLPWLHVISQDGRVLIDSLRIHKDAVIQGGIEDSLVFRVFAVDKSLSWEPHYFALKRSRDAVRLAKNLNAAIPPLTAPAVSSTKVDVDAEALAPSFGAPQASDTIFGPHALMESEPIRIEAVDNVMEAPGSPLPALVQVQSLSAPLSAEVQGEDTEMHLDSTISPSASTEMITVQQFNYAVEVIQYDDAEMTGETAAVDGMPDVQASASTQDEIMGGTVEGGDMHLGTVGASPEDLSMETQEASSTNPTTQVLANTVADDAIDMDAAPTYAVAALAPSASQPMTVDETQSAVEAMTATGAPVDIISAFETSGLGESGAVTSGYGVPLSGTAVMPTPERASAEETSSAVTTPSTPTSDPRLRDPRVRAERLHQIATHALPQLSPAAPTASSIIPAAVVLSPEVTGPYDASLTHERGTEAIRALAANMDAMFMTGTSWLGDDDTPSTGVKANAFGPTAATYSVAGSSTDSNSAVARGSGPSPLEPSTILDENDEGEDGSELAVSQTTGAGEEKEAGGESEQPQVEQRFTAEEIAALHQAIWGSDDSSDEDDED
ncbi:hypothetical protein FRB97_000605 [Tulasnella sp. 331]|nr:hypothetical protein FRB97_000605 [Tulasnella sp. 331]